MVRPRRSGGGWWRTGIDPCCQHPIVAGRVNRREALPVRTAAQDAQPPCTLACNPLASLSDTKRLRAVTMNGPSRPAVALDGLLAALSGPPL